MNKILLSICIPTLEHRKKIFEELFQELKKQSEPYNDQIELLSICDNKEMPIGIKRQKLNEMASGKYVVHWDDDDWICEDGIEIIMDAIKTDADVISYDYWVDIPEWGFGRYQHDYNSIYNDGSQNKDLTWNLFPDMKCPIKKEILEKISFKPIRTKEDFEFIKDLKKHLKTEVKINKFVYLYLNRSKESYEDIRVRFNIKPDKIL